MRLMAANADRQTALLIAAGAALIPFQIWPPMPLAGMTVSDVLFALAFVQFSLARRAIPTAPAAVAIAAFAAGTAVSALFGGSAVKLLGHFMLAAVGWMTACAAPESARTVRRALVLAALVAALTGVVAAVLFYCGVKTPLLNIFGDLQPGHYPRVRGTMIRANMMATVVASGLILLWFERGLLPQPWLRWLVLGLGAVAMLFSFSRTIVPLVLAIAGVELWRRQGPRWLLLAWAGAACLSAAALWVSIRYQVVLNPMRPWAVDVLAVDGTRFAIWRDAVATLATHPLVGAGPGIPVAEGWTAHNTWLNLWAGLGVVPLVAFAYLIAAALARAVAARATGLAAALAVALVGSVYTDIEDMRHIWLLIGLALAIPRPGGSA